MRRTALALTAVAVLGGLAVPSFAANVPVKVTYSTNGGVFVGTTINNNPGAAVWVQNNTACVGFSYEVPGCYSVPASVSR